MVLCIPEISQKLMTTYILKCLNRVLPVFYKFGKCDAPGDDYQHGVEQASLVDLENISSTIYFISINTGILDSDIFSGIR